MTSMLRNAAFAAAVLGGLAGDMTGSPDGAYWSGDQGATTARSATAEKVDVKQKLGQQIPLDLVFRDEQGRPVQLRQLFGTRPVILTPVYYTCPMLCNMVLDGLVTTMRDLRFDAGKEFDVITFSFDPNEKTSDAVGKKDIFVRRYGRPGANQGWRYLTGDAEAIRRLTESLGYQYAYDQKIQQFAHGAMIAVLTPEGRIASYFYGIEYKPRDLRLALVEASGRKVGNVVDQVLLLCYHFDPATGKYSAVAMNVVRGGGIATVIGLSGFVFMMLRRDRVARGREGTSH